MKIEKVEITAEEYRLTIVIPANDILTTSIIEGITRYLAKQREAAPK